VAAPGASEGRDGSTPPLRLFDPAAAVDLLRGWQLHVIRRRNVHEAAARRLSQASYWLGVPTTILAAAAGTSALALGQTDAATGLLSVVGLTVGLGAAITSHLQTSLQLGARAEAHRAAAVGYKRLLRAFELISPDLGALPDVGADGSLSATLRDLEQRLSDVDASAPVVPKRLAAQEERRPVEVATTFAELTQPAG
jgi:hypothetical protein